MLPSLRAVTVLTGFFLLTVTLIPVQAAFKRLSPRRARTLPNWYHRRVCRLIGVRIEVDGELHKSNGVLLVSNHISWLDIPVLSAVAPVSFVAKREVGTWPFVGTLARLQRSVFVDRERRTAVAGTTNEILARLKAGDNVVLFAEGTSSDGNRVLPFKTSLFGAAKPGKSTPGAGEDGDVVVQPMAIAYTGHHGLPLSRRERPMVAWYGDMELAGHAWELLKSGPLEVRISIGTPVPLTDFADRKDLARYTEVHVRHQMAALLRHQTPGAARQPGPDATTAGLQDQVGSAMESGRDAATDERRTSRPSTVG